MSPSIVGSSPTPGRGLDVVTSANTQLASDPPAFPRPRPGARAAVGLTAAVVFCLALWSPIETVDSDPAVALLGAQALLDHGSLRLDPYADRDGLAYYLRNDYRIRGHAERGAFYPNSLGVPIVSVPAVWVANQFGWHMLDQDAEFATQNVLSALGCAAVFLLLYLIGCVYLKAGQSLGLAAVCTFGTTVMSTGATGLWNTNVALVFTSLAVLHAARRFARGAEVRLFYVGTLLVTAFVVRPSTAVFAIACLVSLASGSNRRTAVAARVTLVVTALLVVLPLDTLWPWMAGHYSPARARQFHGPLGLGLYGVLASPSRGLLVFSPFVALIGVGTAWHGARLWRDPLARLCVTWILPTTAMAAMVAGKWWGGYSFGPRLLSDVIPAFVVLACLVWKEITRRGPDGRIGRRAAAALFWVLGGVAVAIHSGQGLFNPAAQQWNRMPDIDSDPGLALDWRFPQFLATAARLDARLDALDASDAEPMGALPARPLGTPVRFDADDVAFSGWYPIEAGWRWSRGTGATIRLRLDHEGAHRSGLHLLEVVAGARQRQRVRVAVNGVTVGAVDLDGFEPVRHLFMVPAVALEPREDTVVDFAISSPGPEGADARQLGLAFRALQWRHAPVEGLTVRFDDDVFFREGFSAAEEGWRWTDGELARIAYPVAGPGPGNTAAGGNYELELLAGANGRQRIEVAINGRPVGEAFMAGFEATRVSLPVPAAFVTPNGLNTVTLAVPDAAPVAPDPRRLGLAVVSVALRPAAEP